MRFTKEDIVVVRAADERAVEDMAWRVAIIRLAINKMVKASPGPESAAMMWGIERFISEAHQVTATIRICAQGIIDLVLGFGEIPLLEFDGGFAFVEPGIAVELG